MFQRRINENIILVDCFDTLIFRKEHPCQVLRRWAKCMAKIYPAISPDRLYEDRLSIIRQCKLNIAETGIYIVYQKLAEKYVAEGILTYDEQACFIEDLCRVEILCESSIHYVKENFIKLLENEFNRGKKIFCVTDYHFSSGDMQKLLANMNLDKIVDKIFSSADYGKTKQSGKLYDVVLNTIKISPKESLMIGDNKFSDIKNAAALGINTWHRSCRIHQLSHKISNFFNKGYAYKNAYKTIGNNIYRSSDCYEEWILIFYEFCRRLHKQILEQGGEKIVFLAREGYFLRKCFEIYQEYNVPKKQHIKTDYLKCSRRAINSVQINKCSFDFFKNISIRNYFKSIGFSNDEIEALTINFDVDEIIENFPSSIAVQKISNNKGLMNLIKQKFKNNATAFKQYVLNITGEQTTLVIVDVGWKGSMQQGISYLFPKINTKGYYIGITDNLPSAPFDMERHGLIFEKYSNGTKSRYFDILRSNTQIYEQLLSAPHGGACYYRLNEGNEVDVIEEWNTQEKLLYNELICDIQKSMLKMFKYFCCQCCSKLSDNDIIRTLSWLVLRSCLLQSKKRLIFMNRLNKGFCWNFNQEVVGLQFNNVNRVYFNVWELMVHPERYVRYFAKLGVYLDNKKLSILRYPINYVFYLYTRLICGL